jgi:hypothetical protein
VALLPTVRFASLPAVRFALRLPVSHAAAFLPRLFREITLLAGIVSVNPSASGVPGSAAVQKIADGIAWWALILSLVGLVIGAASWALGSHSSNYQYATAGRRAVVVSGLAALVIGAAPALVNFFFSTGQQVH